MTRNAGDYRKRTVLKERSHQAFILQGRFIQMGRSVLSMKFLELRRMCRKQTGP